MSKFLIYVKKFLSLSFMSATAAFLMSCSSNIIATVQKVDFSPAATTGEQKAKIDAVEKNNGGEVFTAKDDPSVWYAKNDSNKHCTAIVTKDQSTVYGTLGSSGVEGEQDWIVNKIGAIPPEDGIKSVTLDSWDEQTAIAKGTDAPDLEDFTAVNVSSGENVDNLKFIPSNKTYDGYTKEVHATKTQKNALSNIPDELYFSSKGSWLSVINSKVDKLAKDTGIITLEMKTEDGKYEAIDRDMATNIKDITPIKWSYQPNDNNTYYSKESKEVVAYPLSKFSDHILELCGSDQEKEDTGNGYAAEWEKILRQCTTEYAKLNDDQKTLEEVNLVVNGESTLSSPNNVMVAYATSYVLSAAVRDLCEKKNDENPSSCTEKDILTSIDEKKLSSDDKQYLINMISANYDRLDDLFGNDVKVAAKSSVDNLKKSIEEIPANGDSGSNDSENSGSKDKSNGSDGSSGGSGSSSGS